MIDPTLDANRLAAFVEGRLPAREHAEMLELLASSEEGAALLADIAASHPDLPGAPEGEDDVGDDEATSDPPRDRPVDPPIVVAAAGGDRPRDVIRLPVRDPDASAEAGAPAVETGPEGEAERGDAASGAKVTSIETRRRAVQPRWVAVAAVLAAVALAPVLWMRMSGPGAADPARAGALAAGAPLPAGWSRTAWSGTRGEGDPVTNQTRAARLGRWLVDLDVAWAAGQADTVSLLADRVIGLLDAVPASGPAASYYVDVKARAGQAGDSEGERLLEEGWEAVAAVVDEERLRLGAWAEAGWIGATRQDAAFFRDRGARGVLERAAADPSLSAPARAAAGRAFAALRAEGAPQWDALRRELDTFLREIAS